MSFGVAVFVVELQVIVETLDVDTDFGALNLGLGQDLGDLSLELLTNLSVTRFCRRGEDRRRYERNRERDESNQRGAVHESPRE